MHITITKSTESLYTTEDDKNEFLLIYTTLISVNIFNLNIPIDILRIIAHNAVGTVVQCSICKDIETLITHENKNEFTSCNCETCDKFQRKLVCCEKEAENHCSCVDCGIIYCNECQEKFNCLHECESPYCTQFRCESCVDNFYFCSDIDLNSDEGHYFCEGCVYDSMGRCDVCDKHFDLNRLGSWNDGCDLDCAVCKIGSHRYSGYESICGRKACLDAQWEEYQSEYGFARCNSCNQDICGECGTKCEICEKVSCIPCKSVDGCCLCGVGICKPKENESNYNGNGTSDGDGDSDSGCGSINVENIDCSGSFVGCVNCGKVCCYECKDKWMIMGANLCPYCNTRYCNDCIDIQNHNCDQGCSDN